MHLERKRRGRRDGITSMLIVEIPAGAITVAAEAICSAHRQAREPDLSELARLYLLGATAGYNGLVISCTREVAVELSKWFELAAKGKPLQTRVLKPRVQAAPCLEAARQLTAAIRRGADDH